MNLKILVAGSFVILSALTQNASAEPVCRVDLINARGQTVKVFTAYGDPRTCIEGLKQCRLAIRMQPELGGVDCVRTGVVPPQPVPPHPVPPQPLPPQPLPPQPLPPQPLPPQPGRLPEEVIRMNDIERAINFVFRDCYVVPGVSGWANQLYVNGQFSGNFRMGTQDMELLRTIRDYQFQGKCVMKSGNALIMQFNPYLVESAIDQTLSRNCYVVPGVSGWANQLYVNGQFSGNFNQNTEQMKLKANLADLLENGTCLGRSPEEIRLLRDPNLINDMASFQYRGCYVKLGVSGWANQLYVNNQFSGNFDQRSEAEQHKLQATIVDLILRGSCVYDPIRRR